MFIGSRLKNLREKNKLTQIELGKLLNVTKVSVCCYEKNVRVPSLETLEDMCSLFGVSSDYFLGNDIAMVNENSTGYALFISKEEYEFLKQVKLNKELYNKVMQDPKRTVELITAKLK